MQDDPVPIANPAVDVDVAPRLDRALAHGLGWTGAMQAATQAVTWLATLLVARLLSPEDFGLLAFAAVYLGVVSLLSEFGLATSVVLLRDLTDDQIARLAGFSVLLGAACYVVSVPAAWGLAAFYRTPELVTVVLVMSLSFILVSFRTVPAALLRRDLHFKALAIMDAVRGVLQAGTMVALAILGFRYWTLVIGGLVGSAALTAMTLFVRRHRVAWPRRGALRQAITISLDVLGSRLAWYLYSSADFVVAGRALGPTLTGHYSLAWQIASVPVQKVSSLVMQVTPSILSAVQTNRAALRRYLLNLTEGIALLTFPASLGIALVAEPLVRVVLTDKYLLAVGPLRILALYSAVRAISPLYPPVLNALRKTRFVLWNNVLALGLLPAAFVIGSRWGTVGIALAWVIAHPIIVMNMGRQVFREIELPFADYLRVLWPALTSCLLMGAVVLVIPMVLPDSTSLELLLAAQVCAGAGVYLGALFTLHAGRLERFRGFLRTLRSGGE